MNLALYARVSTDKCEVCGRKPEAHAKEKHEFRGQDPEVQLRELRAWCQREGHTVIVEYVDRGISGKIAARPELLRLMADVEKGRRDIEAVLVFRLTRFGRSVPDLTANVRKLREADVNFISYHEKFDLATPIGKLVFNVLCSIAEFDLDVISENTKAGMRLARAKGHIPGPKVDPAKGPSRTTLWRRGNLHKTGAARA